jgi:serine protease Do
MDRELAGSYDYKLEKGIYVAEIDTESPAYASGIRKDDIILEINNTEINTLTSMKQVLFTAGVGSTVEIKSL